MSRGDNLRLACALLCGQYASMLAQLLNQGFYLFYPLSKSGCCTSCREAYAYERKIRRARNKQNRALAEQLAARRPTHRLDHLVRERCAVNAPFFGAMLLMAAPPCFVSL